MTTTSRFGRARFGGGTGTLLAVAVLGGAALAVGLGLAAGAFAEPGSATLTRIVFAALTLPACAALVWALAVDRLTIAGATQRPEDSVEAQWYNRAAVGAFTDSLAVGGLVGAAFSITRLQAPAGLVLVGFVLVMMVDFTVRYLIARRREG